MKKTVTPVPQPKPPVRVILDLSEGEAALVRIIAQYYAASAADVWRDAAAGAATRLADSLANHAGRQEYPYTDYFKEE